MAKIGITGATGLIGTALVKKLESLSYEVFKLVRKTPVNKNEIYFNASERKADLKQLEGFQCFVNLAGESIEKRWTKANKEKIYSSRIDTTKFLVQILNQLDKKPALLLSSSAIGYYDTKHKNIIEDGAPGNNFLSQVCLDWENEAQKFEGNVCISRTGVVLSPNGGALKKMILPFSLGLGAKLSDGKQLMSCISIEDIIDAFVFFIDKNISGTFNLTSPRPISNEEFSKCLAMKYNKNVYLSAPEFALNLILGKKFTEEMLLASFDIKPKNLMDAGFTFRDNSPCDYIKRF